MAHHQHHGADYEAQVSRSIQSRPTSTTLPAISEDEQLGDADEPPDPIGAAFIKTNKYPFSRRESLITRSLHTDSESHDDDHHFNTILNHIPSISSTASTHSFRSAGDFTSDDGIASQGTRPSTPGSPRSVSATKLDMHMKAAIPKHLVFAAASTDVQTPPALETSVEAQLGRKRCISFACGRKVQENPCKKPLDTTSKPVTDTEVPRPSAIKFACPFKPAKGGLSASKRHLSPAPMAKNNPAALLKPKAHRDSDSTVKNLSPKPSSGSIRSVRRLSARQADSVKLEKQQQQQQQQREEILRFHEFASDEEPEEAMVETKPSSGHLTVDDTLQKEYALRKLALECEEEAVEEGEDDDDFPSSDDDDDDELDDATDDGFQTDDEDGFAASDDDEDEPDSDYDWWTVGRGTRSPAMSPFAVRSSQRRPLERSSSHSSIGDVSSAVSPTRQVIRKRTKARAIPARPGTPELPDSTDFVCGTFDEDKPLEQAYKSCLKQRQAAKRQQCPQDIDPSFPTSDPEESDEDKDKDADAKKKRDTDDEPRGRRMDSFRKPSPGVSPVRHRSPPPKKLFDHSPPRVRSPPPATRLTSPPPSRRGSLTSDSITNSLPFGHVFLGDRREITHTASLPRSPHPMLRRRILPTKTAGVLEAEDDGEETEQPGQKYRRGAIDIAQGLEHKRLKRRQKFHEKYRSKGEKKKFRKPQPGKGAQRMRQVGLDCAVFRGARILSI